ncbi:MAG TPA: hypothetical protein VK638_23870 [Edaphobacter sp.]|nr:hypothetical protein [Edaphobacter sp.]
MTVDPILALQTFGYTEREASFLYLVAVHSGYFLRRQFDYFIDRNKGAIAQNFLEKARIAGHIEVIDYGEARHVYHLFSKPIYRLLGNAESQNRRRKGDGLIRARLIALDYVLEYDSDHYLESDRDKADFFGRVRSIPPEFFSDRDGKLFATLTSFTVSLVDRMQPATSLVRFLFADEALLSTAKFARFLSVLERLLRALRTFEIVYTSNSSHNFVDAEEQFRARFALAAPAKQRTLRVEWKDDSLTKNAIEPAPLHAQFTTLLLHFNYPRIRRNESPSLAMVHPSGLQKGEKLAAIATDKREGGSYVG